MKIKYLYKLLIVAFVAIQLVACSNNDTEQKFDETPTGRINAQSEKLDKLLLSSEYGWKAVYFTDNQQLGGYTHLFKFSPGGKVTMASDFDSDTKKFDSQYEIQLGSTVSVVFTTANRIHLLSDSNSYPNDDFKGQGYLGDFQFLFQGEDKGDIVFRTNRNFRELRFVKATAADWDNLKENIIMEDNVIGAPSRPLFRLLETNDGTTTRQFDFNFDYDTRFATANPVSAGFSESYNIGIGYTPTGIIISPAIVIKDQALSEFVYNDADGSFTATGKDGVSVAIKYSLKPLVLTDDYKILLPGQPATAFGYIASILINTPANSTLCNTLLNEINASLPAAQKVNRVQLQFNDGGDTYITYTFTGGKATLYHNVEVVEDPVKKTITLKHISWQTATALIAEPVLLKKFDQELTNPNGLYVKREAFKLAGVPNTVYTFTSASSNFRLATFAFQ
ncbi:DUF4302 domain-containing protein [Flavobacterium sp. F-65]|jgi:hypothetical protein|uniref:DUF4302 domain-containing protein n=1 Tax=Flavobacterium pisciphilum TaxID=2893755 RepID=A0ABS8MPX1_9FLAO|nr:DUF4302 domain-containing protein [Flavobacterium sp. F-65]MCC9070693.1 DUF4302 domain-containing protein [Flavobacterium sp. F-65]